MRDLLPLLLLLALTTSLVRGAEAEIPSELAALGYMPEGYMKEPAMVTSASIVEAIGEPMLARQHAALQRMPNVRVQYSPGGIGRAQEKITTYMSHVHLAVGAIAGASILNEH